MIALKLVRLIETHSDQLARALIHKVETSSKCAELRKLVPHAELQNRVHEVYKNLSDWLNDKTEHDIFLTYTNLGKRRFEQGVPFHDFMWGLLLTKQTLWEFLESEVVEDSGIQLRSEFELLQLIAQFYDKALYYASLGYWEAHQFEEQTHEHKVMHAV
ncbi:MAG TPA: hypothetical protein VN577_23675 [Terriglobales bacterium]|nr:hypothetical protein [Terriglobales bacterium]